MAYRIVFSFLLALITAGCVSQQPFPSTDPLQQSSAVSVSMPEFITAPGTTLRWRSDLIWIDDPEGRYERRAAMLQSALQDEFSRKGYRFVSGDEQPSYEVVAVALLGEIAGHEEVQRIFQLYPSLAAPAESYGRGNLLVAIAHPQTTDIVWRGALEVFTDEGMQAVEQRVQRMKWGARQVLGSIPNIR